MTCLRITRRVGPHFCLFDSSNLGGIEKIGHGFAFWWATLPPSFIINTDEIFISIVQRFSFTTKVCEFIIFSYVVDIISDHQQQKIVKITNSIFKVFFSKISKI